MLLDCRKGSALFFFSWWFHGAGLSGHPKGRCVAIAGPRGGPLGTSSQPHPGEGQRRGLPEAMQSAVNSQGSCFLSSCHSLFLSGEQWGTAPAPFSLPPSGMRITEERSSDRGSLSPAFLFLLLFLNQNRVCSQSVPLPQVPERGPLHRALQPYTCRLRTPGSAAAFVSGTLSFAWSHASTVQ